MSKQRLARGTRKRHNAVRELISVAAEVRTMRKRTNRALMLMCVLICGLALAKGALGQDVAVQKPSEKSAANSVAKVKAVKFGKLWDGKGKVWTNAIVIVDGERVREVTTDAKRIPARAEVLDLTKYYGLPGLIDAHTHLTMTTNFGYSALAISIPREALYGARNARVTLDAGFTTVRNLGADGFSDVALRDAINATLRDLWASGEYTALYRKYFGTDPTIPIETRP